MGLRAELRQFDKDCDLLKSHISNLVAKSIHSADDEFLAEAIAFRLFRLQERLMRSFFLECCVATQSIAKKRIYSKLRSKDWDTAEEILKAGNRFLEWGNPKITKNLADLIFKNGYPVGDLLRTKHSFLVDLHRIRNFIAHDSKEAESGFRSVVSQYVKKGDPDPQSAGELLLYRRSPTRNATLSDVYAKVCELSSIIRSV